MNEPIPGPSVLTGPEKRKALDEAARVGRADRRPTFEAGGDLSLDIAHAWRLLFKEGAAPTLFRSVDGTRLVHVHEGDLDPVITRHGLDSLRLYLSQRIRFVKFNAKTGKEAPVFPADVLVKSLLASPSPDLPALARVVTAPVFGDEGELLLSPGYHPGSRSFYRPDPGFVVRDVPLWPSPSDVEAARNLLLLPLTDFPFVGPSEVAHALAAVLLVFVRDLVHGPTPLHLICKPAPGTGASLLADVIAIIATGRPAPMSTLPTEEAEVRKFLTTILLQGSPIVTLDNLAFTVRGPALASVLTGELYSDRLLGGNEAPRLPVRCLWLATGINPTSSNELTRRIVRIKLDARLEHPEERQGFRIPNLKSWVMEHRGELVAAALTLGRAWLAAGSPRGAEDLGSFESWARTLGGILEVAGVRGFLGNQAEFRAEADIEGRTNRAFVQAWNEKFGTRPIGVADLFPIALATEGLELGDKGEASQRTRLGRVFLPRLRDSVIAGFTVREGARYQGARQWFLAPVDAFKGPVNVAQRSPNVHGGKPCDFTGSVNVVNVSSSLRACDHAQDRAPAGGTHVHDVHEVSATARLSKDDPAVNVEGPTFTEAGTADPGEDLADLDGLIPADPSAVPGGAA